MYCGVFSILLGPNVSDALKNRNLGVAVWYTYSVWVGTEGSNEVSWVCDDSSSRCSIMHFGQGR
jgi:hypothetical protein